MASSALNVTVLGGVDPRTLQAILRAQLQLPPAPLRPCLRSLIQVITLADFQRFATLGEYPGILAYILVINGPTSS